MILRFKDVTDKTYQLEVFQEEQNVTFQTSNPTTGTCDVSISKDNLYDLIGVLLTIQAKLKIAK